MNFYQRIKAAVTTRQAAEDYGLAVDRSGMALCPFHDDHHPSLKLDRRYYCFGCGESGDVIDFTARYFGISNQSAAIRLARDYGIDPRPPAELKCRAVPGRGTALHFVFVPGGAETAPLEVGVCTEGSGGPMGSPVRGSLPGAGR